MNVAPHDPLPRTSSIIDLLAPSRGGVMGPDMQAAGFDHLLSEPNTMGPHPSRQPAYGAKSTGSSPPPRADAPHHESVQDREGQTPPTSDSGDASAAVNSADEAADDKEPDDEKLGDEANTEAVLVVPQVKLPLEEPVEATASGEDSVASVEVGSAEESGDTVSALENAEAAVEIALRAELQSAESSDTPLNHSITASSPATESGEKFLAAADEAEPAADKSTATSEESQKEDAEIAGAPLNTVSPAADEKSSAGERRSRRRDDGSASTHEGASKSPRSAAESILEPLAAGSGSESAAAPTALSSDGAQPAGASDVAPGGSAPQPAGGVTSAASTPLRLPPEFLTTSTRRSGREAADSPVDAQRILTRVARAFVLAQDGGGELRLRLSPAELGSLRLEVRVQEGVLTARVEAETPAARTVLIENLPALRERLAEQGVRIERFDVDLMQHSPGGTPDHSRQQREPEVALPTQSSERIRTRPQVAEGVAPRAVMAHDLDARRLNIVV